MIRQITLCFTLLGVVWSAEYPDLRCSNTNDCVFHNFTIDVNKEYSSSDLKAAKTLKFENSTFESFPKFLIRLFITLTDLLVSKCNMTTLDNMFALNSDGKNGNKILTSIDFSQNRLTKVEPLNRMTNLKKLNMSYNLIGELDNKSFEGLAHLEEIDLRSNNISKIDATTFSEIPNLKKVNLAHNNLQTLQNLLSINQTVVTIDVTSNKWSCMYAQLLQEIASKIKVTLIGSIMDCSTNWLELTLKKVNEQMFDVTAVKNMLISTIKNCTDSTENLKKKLDEQNRNINSIKENITETKEEIDTTVNDVQDSIKKYAIYKDKHNINPWIMVVILTATTILSMIAGAFAVSFVKNNQTVYKFDAIKNSMK